MGIMGSAKPNEYLRTKVLTAKPEELRSLLIDGALRFAHQAREGLAAKNFEHGFNGISRCQDILMELITSLRPEYDRELCARLSGLYTFLYTRLMQANSQRDPAIVDEVLHLLEFERETWSMVLTQLRSGAGGPRDAVKGDALPLMPSADDLVGARGTSRGGEASPLVAGRVSFQA